MKKIWKEQLIHYKLVENHFRVMKFFLQDYLMQINNTKNN